ncbi:MAG: hypothetical protein ACYCZV_14860, partial [Acidimicrobiales bacterium]
GQVALALLTPGLAAAAARLARAWGLDRGEVDQDVIAAAWERLMALAGTTPPWPATAIVFGARSRVRNRLVTEARRRRLAARLAPEGPAPGPEAEVIAPRLLSEAAARKVVSADAARLVWATRVMGYRLAELAGPGRAESTLRVKRWEAERALRSAAA